MEFWGEFLTTAVEFTKREGFCLVGIEEPLTLPFEALSALEHLGLVGRERGESVLFALRPGLVELRQGRRISS